MGEEFSWNGTLIAGEGAVTSEERGGRGGGWRYSRGEGGRVEIEKGGRGEGGNERVSCWVFCFQ